MKQTPVCMGPMSALSKLFCNSPVGQFYRAVGTRLFVCSGTSYKFLYIYIVHSLDFTVCFSFKIVFVHSRDNINFW